MSRESDVGFEAGNVNRGSWFVVRENLSTTAAIATANCYWSFAILESRISNFV